MRGRSERPQEAYQRAIHLGIVAVDFIENDGAPDNGRKAEEAPPMVLHQSQYGIGSPGDGLLAPGLQRLLFHQVFQIFVAVGMEQPAPFVAGHFRFVSVVGKHPSDIHTSAAGHQLTLQVALGQQIILEARRRRTRGRVTDNQLASGFDVLSRPFIGRNGLAAAAGGLQNDAGFTRVPGSTLKWISFIS